MKNDKDKQFTVTKSLESSAPVSEEPYLALNKTPCSYNSIFINTCNRKQFGPKYFDV